MKFMPLAPRSKKPLRDSYERITDDPLLRRQWERDGCNTGKTLEGLSALDFDELEPARRFAREHPELLALVNRTFRAVHILFDGETQQRPIMEGERKVGDIKSGSHSYLVWPKSRVWQKDECVLHEYKLIRGHEGIELPPFPERLFPETRKEVQCVITRGKVADVHRYIRTIRAVAGQGWHNSIFRVACILRDAEYSEAEALAEMILWAQEGYIEGRWCMKGLAHKCRDAFRQKFAVLPKGALP